ncbi:hypothetical protein ABT369_02185 [Dactylosporangium sp. NPDC000244]|uniref:hypothetical protein n=1 Tax=Dactylosporangium sp. NPDC000244 TaxID=3154365 RepID=UPI003324467A
MTPTRQIRAVHTATTLTVYQAYNATIRPSFTDVTGLAHRVHELVRAGDLDAAQALLPREQLLTHICQ